MNFSEQKADLNSTTLTPQQLILLILVEMRLTNQKKSMGVAVLLWLLFGVIGGHDFYLNRSIYAFLKIFLILFGGFSVGSGSPEAFVLLFVILLLWWIVDVFLLSDRIQECMKQQRQEIIQELLSNP